MCRGSYCASWHPILRGSLSAETIVTAMPHELRKKDAKLFPPLFQHNMHEMAANATSMAHLPDAQHSSVQQGDIRKPSSSNERMQPGVSVTGELAWKPVHANSQPGAQGAQQLACSGVLQSSQENIDRSKALSVSGCCSTPPC